MKKMYLVKKEVWAESIEKAVRGKGRIYCVEMADNSYQPEDRKNNLVGFKINKKQNGNTCKNNPPRKTSL